MAVSVQQRWVGKGKQLRDRYTACVRMDGRVLESKTFNTPKQAREWGVEIETLYEQGKWQPKTSRHNITLDAAIEEWLPLRIDEAKGDGRRERYMGEQWRREKIAKRRLTSLRASDFAEWRDEQVKAKVAPSTIRNRLNFLSPLFDKARVEWGLPIPYPNPIRDVRKPKLKEESERTRRLLAGEYERLLAKASECGWKPMREMIILAVEMAWRQGELREMRWSWVNLDAHCVILPKEVVKTKEHRVTPLSQAAHDALASMDRDASGLVFGGVSQDQVTYYFDRLRTAIREDGTEWGVDLRFHDLRHEACSRLFERGFEGVRLDSIQIAKHFSGHKTISVLADYTHFPDAVRLVELADKQREDAKRAEAKKEE